MDGTETDPELEAHRDRVETVLSTRLDDQWDVLLGQWSNSTSESRKDVQLEVSKLRRRVFDSLREKNSLHELKQEVAIQYLEAKCHWTRLHTKIQFHGVRDGQPKEKLIYRTACIYLVLEALESLVDSDSLSPVVAVLAEPLS